MHKDKIARINELARKKRTEGLTEAEAQERASLHQEYLSAFRRSFESQLRNIYIEQEDGSYERLQKKPSKTQGEKKNDQ